MTTQDQGCIYKIINITNGKFYVGSTVAKAARWRKHLRELRANKHHCPHLQASWNKYGEDSFVFRVVQVLSDTSMLHKVEQEWLDKYHGTSVCYNFARHTDNSSRGVLRSETHKMRISASLRRFYQNNPSPLLGRKHSEESRRKMSENRAGKPVSEVTRDLIRQSRLGTKLSEETKARLSEAKKGKARSPEHAAKYNKPVLEITTGQVFPSLKVVKETFGLSPGSLAKALAANKPISRGKNKGKHFQYHCALPVFGV